MQFVLYDYLLRLVGLPYRWSGDDAIQGFDCSGLAIEYGQAAGLFPKGFDTTASGLEAYLLKNGGVKKTLENASFGCFVFFGSPISHVGIILDKFHMIEAGGGDSKTISLEAAANQNAFVRIRPITWRKDITSIVLPNYPFGRYQQ